MTPHQLPTVTDHQAGAWARLACANVTQEFPHATHHTVRGPDEVSRPSMLHPSFHGSFDWHSAVHMHWLLVSLLGTHPNAIDRSAVVACLDAHLDPDRLAVEAAYLASHRTFERPYGWAWLLALHAAALRCDHPHAAGWAAGLDQTSTVLADLISTWTTSALPIRHGVHTNSAFAAVLIRDAAPVVGRPELVGSIDQAARRWFGDDHDAPVHTEPSAHDFLSPTLTEADLMHRVLSAAEFANWLPRFLPTLGAQAPTWLEPNAVHDPSDGNQVHLYGLGLSRAWQLDGLADSPAVDPAVAQTLRAAAGRNLAAGLTATDAEGEFMSDHWLASFAYLALQRPF